MQNATLRNMRHDQEVCSRQHGRKHILRDHHLRPAEARIQLRRGEDMVLRGICQTIQKEIDTKQEDTPAGRARIRSSNLLTRSRVVQAKSRHAEGDHQHHAVLVQGVFLAEDGQVQDHDGEELA